MSSQPLLDIRGVTKRFGGIQAVAEANLRVERGEMIGLVGPNGCGKSTTLNIVAGLLNPDEGEGVFEGTPLAFGDYRETQARGILLVPQELALVPEDTVWESVVLGEEPRRAFWVDRREARNRATEALALLGHEIDPDSRVSALSPVERRLVMIARGAARPHVRLLILDEPTAGLPHDEALRVIAAMHKLMDSERGLILVSHHIEDIVAACHKVTVMRDGRTVHTLEGRDVNKDHIVGLLLGGEGKRATQQIERRAPGNEGEELASLSAVNGQYLRGFSMTARRGEVVGVAGLLGSGAGEVAEMLIGRRQPAAGEVRVGRLGIRPTAPHRALSSGVGYISGDRSSLVIKSATVSEHVALTRLGEFSHFGFVSRKAERAGVEEALAALAVKGTPEVPMTSLSGGNQQRALMARWYGTESDLLVVDQPTVGVDLAGRVALLAVLRKLADDRAVVLVAEPDDLAGACDRVLCLRRGLLQLELQGSEIDESRILDAIS